MAASSVDTNLASAHIVECRHVWDGVLCQISDQDRRLADEECYSFQVHHSAHSKIYGALLRSPDSLLGGFTDRT